MTTETEERQRGRFSVDVELANNGDREYAERGDLPPEQVRRVKVRGVVDTGATMMVVPEAVVRALGLKVKGTTKVRYANGQTAERPIARNISLSYGGRESVFDAVVEPARTSALIGAIVLEVLDFIVDCGRQRLVPRDPDQIITEVE
jgi:predicted aspartyl protease